MFRMPYDRIASDAASAAASDKVFEASIASKSEAASLDINEIVRRFGVSGELPVSQYPPSYGEFPSMTYHEALEQVRLAQERFMALPARVRSEFGNDVGQLLDAVSKAPQDEKLAGRLLELGLLKEVAGVVKPDVAAPGVAPSA